MPASNRLAEIAAVERFLSDRKELYGAPPEFGASNFFRQSREWNAIWPIQDSIGVVDAGQLRFVVREPDQRLSISLIFKGRNITRIDFVPLDECEPNPPYAARFGLPARVCGPHIHNWASNKQHIGTQDQWTLTIREPLPAQVRRFEQAFPWLADRVNLVLTPDQRSFEPPRRLF